MESFVFLGMFSFLLYLVVLIRFLDSGFMMDMLDLLRFMVNFMFEFFSFFFLSLNLGVVRWDLELLEFIFILWRGFYLFREFLLRLEMDLLFDMIDWFLFWVFFFFMFVRFLILVFFFLLFVFYLEDYLLLRFVLSEELRLLVLCYFLEVGNNLFLIVFLFEVLMYRFMFLRFFLLINLVFFFFFVSGDYY